MKNRLKRTQQFACLILILTSGLVALSLSPRAAAAMTVSVDPSTGNVGTLVAVTGNVTTAAGAYEVRFDEQLMANGSAPMNIVSASFTVPQAVAGTHVIRLTDVSTGDNVTGTFNVTTSYSVNIQPMAKPLQEGDSVPITVNITGGEASTTYVANVTVQVPSNELYAEMLNVTTSTFGNGTATANYPSDFSTGANTRFVGNYGIFLNTTISNNTFSVGLTNATEYHRTQTVNIKAVYAPNENVTLTVAGKDIYDSVNLTDPSGVINYNWTVPSNASIGTYAVNVLSASGPTTKSPPDSQNFTVPGFDVNVTAKNLAGDSVPYVGIITLENGNIVSNTTTLSTGMTALKLEIGNYTCEAYVKNEKVSLREVEINDASSLDLVCNLTNLKIQVISVVDGIEMNIPEAWIYMTPDNTTSATDINGTFIVHSLLPNVTYGLNVSRYNTSFNLTTIPTLWVNLTAVAWFNVTVTCPTLTLHVTATKSDGQPLSNVLVRAQEMLGAPRYEGHTDANGAVVFNSPLGRYTVDVYDNNGIMLNETTVDLFQNQNVSIPCNLYGLTVSVKVVDYFGQGIADVNVNLQREGQPAMIKKTQSDGTATFNNVVGGDLEIALYLGDSTQPIVAQDSTIESSTTIQVKIDKYVVLAGLLVETSQLATVIIIVLAIVLFLSIEVYRRRRSKTEKSETKSSDKES
jgi:hypothetical protein